MTGTAVLESVDILNHLEQATVMSWEAAYKSCGIPDEILDGIFPEEMIQTDQNASEKEEKKKKKPCEKADDTLDAKKSSEIQGEEKKKK